jgi:hypothetical protein
MFTDIKQILKKYLKNPILIAAGAYILWKFINRQKKKEGLIEAVKVIEDTDNYNIIFDTNTNKYILMYKNKVYSSDNEQDLRKMIK